MKFSKFLLLEFINKTIDNSLLLNYIAMSGLEVDHIEPVSKYFTGVVIGKIFNIMLHPKCNKFNIIQIDVKKKKLINVICKINKNLKINSIFAVATIGSILPNNFIVKKIKIYDNESEGFFCSFYDLGLCNNTDKNKDNMIELPFDAPIGKDLFHYLKLNDYIFDIKIAYNRVDCLSILGLSRTITTHNKNLKLIFPKLPLLSYNKKKFIPVIVKSIESCPKYLSRIITDVNVNSVTPLWMREKLRRSNIQSTNVISDIVNYVLLELGQPITIFDYDKIDKKIIIRYAKEGEEFFLMKDKKILLSSDTLVVSDNSKIISLAGVVNSSLSSISTCTKNIVLESAYFCPHVIQNSVCKYSINNENSYRFAKGVDYNLLKFSIDRISFLLVNICGGDLGSIININNIYSTKFLSTVILNKKNIYRFVGIKILDIDLYEIIIRIGCQIYCNSKFWFVIIPSWRFDIKTEEDLIDEVIRIYGYSIIPNHYISHCPYYPLFSIKKKKISLLRLKMLLVDRGYNEVITYTFVNPKEQLLLHPYAKPIIIPNPVSKDMSVMRLSLWTGLINVIRYNQNRQQELIRIFESGFRFVFDNTAELGIRQDFMFSGIISGYRYNEQWNIKQNFVDFYDIKGDTDAIFELIGNLNNIKYISQYHPTLHPKKSAAIYLNNEFIGIIGSIHPNLKNKFNLRDDNILLFELIWKKFSFYHGKKFVEFSKFPSNRRDLSFIVKENIIVSDIIDECKNTIKDNLLDINIFDIYSGNNIKNGYKNISISLILQSKTHTLEEKEINLIIEKCINILKRRFNIFLRN